MSSAFLENLLGAKTLPAIFGLAVAGAVLLPLRENLRKNPKDDFPLSYYPMFTASRGRYTIVNYFVGEDGAGGRRLLPASLAGGGGLNQVRKHINLANREGRADELCDAVARAVAGSASYSDLRTVYFMRGSYRLERYFGGEKRPKKETVLASSVVKRGAT